MYNDHKNTHKKTGIYVSIVGMLVNILLFLLKGTIGFFSHSVAITADAMNNLMDSVSSFVMLIGFLIAFRNDDALHPYGHGRLEYLCGFMISLLIVGTGISVGKSAVSQIMEPTIVSGSTLMVALLLLSVFIKLMMFVFVKKMNKEISSTALKAIQTDSISDAWVTLIALIGMIAAPYTTYPIDGWVGLFVTILILKSGIQSLLENFVLLIGEGISSSEKQKITTIFDDYVSTDTIQDIALHDYGPEKKILYIGMKFTNNEEIYKFSVNSNEIKIKIKQDMNMDTVLYLQMPAT